MHKFEAGEKFIFIGKTDQFFVHNKIYIVSSPIHDGRNTSYTYLVKGKLTWPFGVREEDMLKFSPIAEALYA